MCVSFLPDDYKRVNTWQIQQQWLGFEPMRMIDRYSLIAMTLIDPGVCFLVV